MDMNVLVEYKKTGDIRLRNKLIEDNVGLVKFVVSKMPLMRVTEYEFNDLVGYGIFGLIDAIEKFDCSRGFSFSSYASIKIYGAIIDAIRKNDWVPRSVRSKIKKAETEIEKIRNRFGFEVDISEIAKSYGLTDRDIAVMNGTCISSLEDCIQYVYVDGGLTYDYVLC